ncbi:MAG: acyltransferase [Bacteroidales bacterium]
MSYIKSLVKSFDAYHKYRRELLLWQDSINMYFLNVFISKFPSHRFRLFILRMKGATLDKSIAIQRGCQFWNPAKLDIGSGSVVGFNVNLDSRKGLVIGKNVTIASDVMIWTLHHDYNDPQFSTIGNKVSIGDYAWVCSRAIILPGVSIGEGAVVAAGAVVSRDVAPYTVVGGVPAKKIAERNKSLNYIPSQYKLHLV